MTTAYKHVKVEFARRLDMGRSIKIGTFSHFRELEDQGPRHDPHEGQHLVDLNGFGTIGPTAADAERRAALLRYGIDVTSISDDVLLENNRLVMTLPDEYIFCASKSPDRRYITTGHAIIEISDLEAFASCLSPEIDKAGIRVSVCNVGDVAYEDVKWGARTHSPPPPSSFRKRAEFAHENEIRIVWSVLDKPPPVLYLRSTLAAQYLRIIEMPPKVRNSARITPFVSHQSLSCGYSTK